MAAAALVGIAATPAAGLAQEVERGTSALDLPRAGYEPRNLRFGATVVAPELRLGGNYDSNVFATSSNEDDDFILSIAPRIDVTTDTDKLLLRSDAYVTRREYLDNSRESRTDFGLGTKGDYRISSSHSLSLGGRFDRQTESRADPEASDDTSLPPRKINLLAGEVGYRYRMNRIGLSALGGVDRQNYLAAAEADRDMTTWRGALRVSAQLSAGKDVFLQGFVNRRDTRVALDRSGVDRDTTTIGFFAGASLEIATRWRGEMGMGLFRADPDDPTLRSFTGLGASGRITWSPDERTAITADVFRGDVGTIQSGASGRIDTKASLRLDQEIRHNLLMSARIGVRRTTYRGGARDQRQTTASAGAEIEYLMNRHVSVFVNGGYAQRFAPVDTKEFTRATAGIGLRLRY